MKRGSAWIALAALLVPGGCSPWGPQEVQAAAPDAPAEPTEPEPGPEPLALRSAQAPEPELDAQPDVVAGVAELVAWLDAEPRRDLTLAEADLERLFRRPERLTERGPYGARFELDVVGDPEPERVAVLSEGWFGQGFRVCLFEPAEAGWRLRAHVRMDGVCRGLPTVARIAAPERAWLRVEWVDGFESRVRTGALALLEVSGDRLEPVLRAPSDGYHPGSATRLSVSFQIQAVELERLEDGVEARLTYGLSAGAEETGLGRDLWAGADPLLRFRQPGPGQAFTLHEPAGRGDAEAALFDSLAIEAWLGEHAELAGRLALEGSASQQLVLLGLAEALLDCASPPQATSLIALLPPRSELEAAAAAAIR